MRWKSYEFTPFRTLGNVGDVFTWNFAMPELSPSATSPVMELDPCLVKVSLIGKGEKGTVIYYENPGETIPHKLQVNDNWNKFGPWEVDTFKTIDDVLSAMNDAGDEAADYFCAKFLFDGTNYYLIRPTGEVAHKQPHDGTDEWLCSSAVVLTPGDVSTLQKYLSAPPMAGISAWNIKIISEKPGEVKVVYYNGNGGKCLNNPFFPDKDDLKKFFYEKTAPATDISLPAAPLDAYSQSMAALCHTKDGYFWLYPKLLDRRIIYYGDPIYLSNSQYPDYAISFKRPTQYQALQDPGCAARLYWGGDEQMSFNWSIIEPHNKILFIKGKLPVHYQLWINGISPYLHSDHVMEYYWGSNKKFVFTSLDDPEHNFILQLIPVEKKQFLMEGDELVIQAVWGTTCLAMEPPVTGETIALFSLVGAGHGASVDPSAIWKVRLNNL